MISYKEAAEVEYVHAIINETLRKGSIAPHMVPHMSLDDCFIDNRFYIPKHAIIIPNVYHINVNFFTSITIYKYLFHYGGD